MSATITATCVNCGQPIRLAFVVPDGGHQIWDHPGDAHHTVCNWREGMAPTDVVATPDAPTFAAARLEYLRGELRAERISYAELAELADLAEHIDPGDVELLEAAGVPEFPEDDDGIPEPGEPGYPSDTLGQFRNYLMRLDASDEPIELADCLPYLDALAEEAS